MNVPEPAAFFCGQKQKISEEWNFFTLRAVTRKRKEIMGWAIKCQMMDMHRGLNAFLQGSFDGVLVARSTVSATK